MTTLSQSAKDALLPLLPYYKSPDMARTTTADEKGSLDADALNKSEADELLDLGGFSCSSDGHDLPTLHDTQAFFDYFLAVNFMPGLTAAARAIYQVDLERESVEVARVLLRELPLQEHLAVRVATTIQTHRCNLLRLISTIATALVREKFAPLLAARSAAADREGAATEPTPSEGDETVPTTSDGDVDGWKIRRRRHRQRLAPRRGTFEGLSTVFDKCGREYVVVHGENELMRAISALGGVLFRGCTSASASSIREKISPPESSGEFSSTGAFYVTDNPAFATARAKEKSGGVLFDDGDEKPPGPLAACIVLYREPDTSGLSAAVLQENHLYRQYVYANVTDSDDYINYPELWDTADVVAGPICRSADPKVLRNYTDVQCYEEGTQTAYRTLRAVDAIQAALVDKAILLAKGFPIRSPK